MAHAWYKITITENNYDFTKYTAWVSASSKNTAIVQGAALAGQAKMKREYDAHMGDELWPTVFLAPEVKLEVVSYDEYEQHEDEVLVSD